MPRVGAEEDQVGEEVEDERGGQADDDGQQEGRGAGQAGQAGQGGQRQAKVLEGLFAGGQAAGNLTDDAGGRVRAHGVGVAVEGVDVDELVLQEGLRHPVLRGYVPVQITRQQIYTYVGA